MYQFSSRQGTMSSFISYLLTYAPDIANELQHAGASDTGSIQGKMPLVWQEIAKREPERFAMLQHEFAIQQYYKPMEAGFKTLLPRHQAIQEVLFSTAIQHGVQGATSIIQEALQSHYHNTTDFIQKVYDLRKQQFSSSHPSIRVAVQNRLLKEMNAILALYTS